MEITIDEIGTIISIHFCCSRLSRKMVPAFHSKETPIVIYNGLVRAKGFSLHYCPYCGEKIERNEVGGELKDPLNTRDEDLEEAVKLLDQDNRRLIVLDDGKVTGILTVRDVIRRVLTDRKDLEEDLRNYIDYSVATIWEETPLKCALRIMGLSKVIALPVLDDVGKLVGMVQEFDLIQDREGIEEMNRSQLYVGSETQPWAWESNPILLISEKKIDLPQKPVKEVMETDVVTARPDDKVWQAANKMKQNNIEQLPVLDAEDNLIGVIRDVELIKSI